MSCSRAISTHTILSKQSAAQTLKALNGAVTFKSATRPAFVVIQHGRSLNNTQQRPFSGSSSLHMKEFFSAPQSPHIKITVPAWPHPIYTEEQMNDVIVAHRNAKTWSDYIALSTVKTVRWCFDTATGYKHAKAVELNERDPAAAKHKYQMTEKKYMVRNIFLESIAGVPGMVGGMLRHLRSMRRMKRDNGWMETLLEESYNERMHLLTFLQMAEPGLFMRLMVLGAQGVFFNAFFVCYLISPRTCHRFVGYLEEEAVITYTRQIEDLDAGKLPFWEKMEAPPIAIEYWKMPEGKRSMRDLLLYIRADESKHREVNHTLANLDQQEDPNPFVSKYKDEKAVHPTKGIEHPHPQGWERDEVI